MTAQTKTPAQQDKDAPAGAPAAAQPQQHQHRPEPHRDSGRQRDEVPSGPRLHARIGDLGWDTEAATLTELAWEALEKAGISPQDIAALTPVTGRDNKGSGAKAMFRSEETLQAAKMKVRQARVTCVDAKYVWLDVKKTRAELAPARAIHRCGEIIQDLESRRPGGHRVEKNVGSKVVCVGGSRAFFTLHGQMKATYWATRRYAPQEVESVLEYSAAD